MSRWLMLLLMCGILVSACRSGRQRSAGGRPSAADVEAPEMHAVIYHFADSSSAAYLQVMNDNLLYRRPDTSSAFYAELRVSYRLSPQSDYRKVADSGSFFMRDRIASEKIPSRPIISQFMVRSRQGNSYLLELEIVDVGRRKRFRLSEDLDRSRPLNRQYFLVTREDTVSFSNSFDAGQVVTVRTAAKIDVLNVDAFLRGFGPALPPFSTRPPDEEKYKPDSTFTMPLAGGLGTLTMPAVGFFHLRPGEQEREGLSLFTFDESFPGVSDSDEMIDCTRYIMNRQEYEDCKSATDKKAAIDRFWLNIAGSNERARELLRRYYGRVQEANRRFTSYTEGWKTDRGMIFIVFGSPVNVHHVRKSEIWVYGNEANPNSLRFVFNKTENPFSDNDYVLERSPLYRDQYHTAVDYWRQGVIYTENRR